MEPKKQKILYIITKSSPLGGAQKAVIDLATNFKDEFEVAVAAGGLPAKQEGGGILFEALKQENIKTFKISGLGRDIKFFSDIKSFFSIYKIILNFKPDVIHLHSPKAALLGSIAGKLIGVKKIIYTVHGWPFMENRPKWQKKLLEYLSFTTSMICDKIIVLSFKEKARIKFWHFITPKVFVVKNGIKEFEMFSQEISKRKISEIHGKYIQENIAWVVTIAELTKNKGLEYSVKALSNMDILYFIIGEGSERKELEKLIEQNNSKNILLLGNVPDAKKYLKAFDIFLLPSLKEGLPYVLLEAGLAEVSVVSTDVGGISNLIENGKEGILIESQNTVQIEKTVRELSTNGEKRSLFAKNLKRKILTENSIEKQMEETLKLYQ
ncbi:MAG: glycosyltransferase [Candidatus Paceibacterota bacterium]